MKITNLNRTDDNDRAGISATIEWEDCGKTSNEIFFATKINYADELNDNYNSFLVASILPAMFHGEKRVLVDGEVCPELKENIVDALGWICHWFYPKLTQPKVEIKQHERLGKNGTSAKGFFLSGGVDSLAALRHNSLVYPESHPGRYKLGMMIYGQNIESDTRLSTFNKAFEDMNVVAGDAGLSLIPVYTNVRELEPSNRFFSRTNGSILASVGHAFGRRIDTLSIAATENIQALMALRKTFVKPLGSHPLVDTNYSSFKLKIRHDGIMQSRIEKIKLITGWDVALQRVKVCSPNWPGDNCGECEKCIRTMLGLLALGDLRKTKAFPFDDVSSEMVRKIKIKKPVVNGSFSNEYFYLELIPLFEGLGRKDLVNAIGDILKIGEDRFHRKSFRDSIEEFDKNHFGGNVKKIKKAVLGLKYAKGLGLK